MLPVRIRRSAGMLILMLSMLMALAIAAPVAAKNPPGNNGTVKIDGVEFDKHSDNQPHVGCIFEVDFYGFDADVADAQVIFDAHAPTGHGNLDTKWVDLGSTDNEGAGSEAGWDAKVEVNLKDALSAYAPHAQQGYHVKLTVHAPGSLGADTKHKVFWVTGCDPITPLTPLTPLNPLTPLTPTPPTPPTGGGTLPGSSDPVRGGTAAGSSGPVVVMLPNTAMETSTPLALLAGMVLLGGSATLAVVEVRRERSRRR